MEKPPQIVLVEDNVRTLPEDGFLHIKRSDVIFNYPNGDKSSPFTVDRIVRRMDDAVIIVAWYLENNELFVYLRSSIRPAIALKDYTKSQLPEDQSVGNLWELPAGCIDTDEVGQEGVLLAAARETKEELGFIIKPNKFNLLGNRTFSSVGMSGERLYFVECNVKPSERGEPVEDGGPFEAFGKVVAINIIDALKAIDDGEIVDSHTEIGVRRLYESLIW